MSCALKASNVLVRHPSEELQLVDFGLSLRFKQPMGSLRTTYQSEQRVGVYGYMPPEVFRCEPYGAPVDIFAFGVILSRMLRRAAPLGLLASAQRVLHAAPFDLVPCALAFTYSLKCSAEQILSAQVPHDLASLVHQCCQGDQAQRPSIGEVLSALGPL